MLYDMQTLILSAMFISIRITLIHAASEYVIVEGTSSEYAYRDVKRLRAQCGPTKKFLRARRDD